MLERAEPSGSGRVEPAQDAGAPALSESAPERRVVQPRIAIGIGLIVAGLVWTVARGLHFYGVAPLDLAYDLDQPPLLLVFVGIWLAYRSRSR
jgi:hypothetical protein